MTLLGSSSQISSVNSLIGLQGIVILSAYVVRAAR